MKILYILLFIPCIAFAHENVVNNTTNVANNYTDGTALAIASSQLQFDSSTYQTQVGVGAGNYNGNSAISIGIGKRFKESGPLLNGSIGNDGSHTGVGVGATWRF